MAHVVLIADISGTSLLVEFIRIQLFYTVADYNIIIRQIKTPPIHLSDDTMKTPNSSVKLQPRTTKLKARLNRQQEKAPPLAQVRAFVVVWLIGAGWLSFF